MLNVTRKEIYLFLRIHWAINYLIQDVITGQAPTENGNIPAYCAN